MTRCLYTSVTATVLLYFTPEDSGHSGLLYHPVQFFCNHYCSYTIRTSRDLAMCGMPTVLKEYMNCAVAVKLCSFHIELRLSEVDIACMYNAVVRYHTDVDDPQTSPSDRGRK